jgi:hypothetical protein
MFGEPSLMLKEPSLMLKESSLMLRESSLMLKESSLMLRESSLMLKESWLMFRASSLFRTTSTNAMGYSWITRFFLESGCARLRIGVEAGSFGFGHPGGRGIGLR